MYDGVVIRLWACLDYRHLPAILYGLFRLADDGAHASTPVIRSASFTSVKNRLSVAIEFINY
jgi:hypothetical protein